MKRVVSFLLGYVKAHTMSYSDWMPLRRVLCTLLLCIAALWAMPTRVHAQTFKTLYSFAGGSDGSQPNLGPLINVDGALYGTTIFGGTGTGCFTGAGCGTVFEINLATGIETVLHSFNGSDG